MRIGYIGLGSQGSGMAEMIAKAGHQLVVWARRPGVVDPFVALGAIAANSPGALAAQCEIVGTCVMADDDVIDLAESQGVLRAMASGSVFVNHATVRPGTAARLGEAARPYGVQVVDAPVSGSSIAARDKTLLVMAGGEPAAIDAAMPMFDCYAKVVRCGALGDGQVAKLVNNGLYFATSELAHRAIQLAAALGVDPDLMREVVAGSSGASFAAKYEPMMFNPAGASHVAALATKDIGLLKALAAEHGLDAGIVGDVASRLIDSLTAAAAPGRGR
jgi:3-hydroxyisobutyrate dehydrogenase-like beta-hydroxyacid dehydrogenase